MSSSAREQVREVQRLYKAGDCQAAVQRLRPIIQQHPSNAKLWLLMARISPSDEDTKVALHNVLKIDPNNAQAQSMLVKMGDRDAVMADAASRGQSTYTKQLGSAGGSKRKSGGIIRQQVTCEACGASLSISESQRITECSFCGATHFIEMPAAQQDAVDVDELETGYILPFRVKPNACGEITQKWLGSSWMTPASLKNSAQVGNFTPVYLPFWAFDADIRGQWQAEIGYEREEVYYDSDGDRQTRTEIEWRHESGIITTDIRKLKVPATTHLSEVLVSRADDYDLNMMRPYDPSYTEKIVLQVQDVPAHKAYDRARDLMEDQVVEDIENGTSNRIRNIRLAADFRNESHCAIKLPVYMAVYTFKDETYQLVINGQTGNVSGQRPVDWLVVIAACVAIIIPAIVALVLHFTVDVAAGTEATRFLWIAGLAGLIGLIADAYILYTASTYKAV